MSNVAELLERESRTVDLEPGDFERLTRRRDRKQRNRRVAAGVLGIAVFALAAIGFARLLGSERTPASDPRSPFEGTWVSTTDTDGGTQTMTVLVSADGAVEITVTDDVATECSGTPSTMTGTGRIEGGTQLVIPAPVYTCDDGSEPETLSGPPLEAQLPDWTLFLHPPPPLEGEVPLSAAPPWTWICCSGPWHLIDGSGAEFYVLADPRPVETGC